MFTCMSGQAISNEPFLLDEEQIETAQPAVRALTLQRLEAIWGVVEKHLDPELGADPRWAEIGLRVLDREARLYRLDRTKPREADEDDELVGVDRGAILLAQLEEIEAVIRPAQPAQDQV